MVQGFARRASADRVGSKNGSPSTAAGSDLLQWRGYIYAPANEHHPRLNSVSAVACAYDYAPLGHTGAQAGALP